MKEDLRKRALLLLTAACFIAAILTVSMLTTVRCIVVSTHDGRTIFAAAASDGDDVIISHNNSIYDAPVDEHLEVRGGCFSLTKVVTDSQGVMEYYGIADGNPRGEWPVIRVFSTGERNFSLKIKGIPVDTFKKQKDTHFIIEMKKLPFYRFALLKLHLFI